jgi:nucleoid-associated protein YgaU
LLAQKFYDDVTAWPVIANANGLGKGSLLVKPGTILRIPAKQTFTDLISQLNNRR